MWLFKLAGAGGEGGQIKTELVRNGGWRWWGGGLQIDVERRGRKESRAIRLEWKVGSEGTFGLR